VKVKFEDGLTSDFTTIDKTEKSLAQAFVIYREQTRIHPGKKVFLSNNIEYKEDK
jgi:hypothetical protein